MKWNWELPNWPNFNLTFDAALELEKRFLLHVGESGAFLKSIHSEDRKRFIVDILSKEALSSSKIEGEILDRESLQSSIHKHFGLKSSSKLVGSKESGMAKLLCDVYDTHSAPLNHEMLFTWHSMLFGESAKDLECGKYRSHKEPMQIVSNRYDKQVVFFQAPPSHKVYAEMEAFIDWFNSPKNESSILAKAAIAHIYFESIHPFEDGNGRIGRALIEKSLSKSLGKPILLAISKVFEQDKKRYYAELGKCNHTLSINSWGLFFFEKVLEAQRQSLGLLNFLIGKFKLLSSLSGKLNPRQEKALLRMFAEGPDGFKGGLSAENYITITKTSRATATRDLTDLVDLKALLKTGNLRHTRYWLNIKTFNSET